MTDFRALCAELVEDIEEWLDGTDHCPPSSVALVNRARAALAESIDCVACEDKPASGNSPCSLCGRIAEPQPAANGGVAATGKPRLQDGPAVQSREPASVTTEPSDEELLELMPQQMRDDLAAAARALAGSDPDNIKAASVFRIILNRHVADHARAVLARWGTPNLAETRSSLEPIPVSERLPELRGQFERILCIARSSGGPTVGNIQLADRLINAVRGWLPAHTLPLPKEVE